MRGLPCSSLNLNLYRVFYITAKENSFTSAAEILSLQQPAITRHIQELEYELKTILFYRSNKGIKLTSSGEDLLSYVEKSYNLIMLGEKKS